MSASLILFLGFYIISLRYINRAVCENISLRIEADAREKRIGISEQRYRLLLNHSPVGIFHYDTNFVITYCNDRFSDIMCNPVEHITGIDMKMLKDQSIMPAMKKALEGELGHYEGYYMATFSDVDGWVSMICAPSRDDTGKVVGGVAIIQDITERKIMEKQLAHQVQVHALADERQRIMQDMHDGFGSQLISSLIMVEHGRASQAEIAQLLRECIDDLRLTIDALTPGKDEEHTDLMMALGTLRQRMEPRLHSAGIALNWHLAYPGDTLQVASRTALQVLRIVQEALCNVLKHAGATAIQVVVAADSAAVDIRITDNGTGFDILAPTHGRGIGNMRKRMHELGGALDLSSSGAGTQLHLCLPHLAPAPG
ncbi:MAG: PAS domain-containing protein [Gallionella sp.]|nr:PAS domain-containing protein [Gallionella sp.]